MEHPIRSSDRRVKQKVKILLVDDDPVVCSMHSMLLRAQGHEVVIAALLRNQRMICIV
jgi:DNA-binding NtrC family response regulator